QPRPRLHRRATDRRRDCDGGRHGAVAETGRGLISSAPATAGAEDDAALALPGASCLRGLAALSAITRMPAEARVLVNRSLFDSRKFAANDRQAAEARDASHSAPPAWLTALSRSP